MLERKWPPIRNALIYRLFIPYLLYLILFSYYTLNLREIKYQMEYDRNALIMLYLIKAVLGLITLYFAKNEVI